MWRSGFAFGKSGQIRAPAALTPTPPVRYVMYGVPFLTREQTAECSPCLTFEKAFDTF